MPRRRARIEEIEPRVLLSADLAGGLALPPTFVGDEARAHAIVEDVSIRQAVESRREWVFVDAGIDDRETLIDDLLGQHSDERRIEVFLLDAERDGLHQISEALDNAPGEIDAVHVVSHGTTQGIQLGGTWLDAGQLDRRSELVASWRDALSEDADLLLYGCNLAGGGEGKALIDRLARLTGADVAASTDPTGAVALGGDWQLEHATGSIESLEIFTAKVRDGFGTLLDGTAIWADKDESTAQTSEFDGSSFAPEGNTAVVGTWEIIVGAEAPTRDEKIVMGIDKDGNLTAQRWDGTSWTVIPSVVDALSDEEWAFDVAYSSQSGDALIVWNDGTTGGLNFVTWDGTTLSGVRNVGFTLAGESIHLEMASDPNSDAIMLVGSTPSVGDFALEWDGSDFVSSVTFTGGTPSPHLTDIDVIYEGTSGNAMVVMGNGGEDMDYAVFDGVGWTTGIIADPLIGSSSEGRWTELAADPNSDRIGLIVGTDSDTAWATVWDGSSWEASELMSDHTQDKDRSNLAVAFESTSGELIAAYTRHNERDVRYQRWSSAGGWSGELTGPALSDHVAGLALDADPNSDAIMLSLVENDDEVGFILWDGDGFGTPATLETDADTNKGQPYLFLWDQEVVTPNTAPVLTPAMPSLPTITEDETDNTGALISDLLGSSVSDADGGALEGIALVDVTSSNGTWEYDIGGGWTAVGSVSKSSALLLRATDRVRFVPDAQNADSASFEFRAWDQTSGNAGDLADTSLPGGTSAYSTATDLASITVTAVNDAPTLSGPAPQLGDIAANSGPPVGSVGTLVSDLVDFAGGGGHDNVVDVDSGAVTGIAITQALSSNGTLYYTTDGGTTWLLVGSPSNNNALLLAADLDTRIYFEPDSGFSGSATDVFRFRAWDQSTGTNGGTADTTPPGGTTAFSTDSRLPDITVTIASSEPSGSNNTVVVDEDATYVFDTADFGFSDTDGDGFESVVITTAPGTGVLRDGVTVLGDGDSVTTAAILAGDLTFTPLGDENGTPYTSFTFQVRDDSGLAGADLDSTLNTMTIHVTAVNDAPVLVPATPSLSPISEDEVANDGDLVSDLLGSSVSDADAGDGEGIAITSATSSFGTWEYSTTGGVSWSAMPGTLAQTSALLLRETDLVRFVPDGENAEVASFDFRAWDRSSGTQGTQVDVSTNGGTTPYSAASDTASVTVSAQNDAPVLTPTSPTLTPIDEDETTNGGDLVSSFLGGLTDVDSGSAGGIAITSLTSSNGTWQYSINGGTSWNDVGTVSDASARLLRETDLVRFVPDGENADAASFTFRAWDQTSGAPAGLADTSTHGGSTAFSSGTDTASITVGGLNDAPVLDNTGTMTLTNVVEDDTDPPGNTVASILLTAGGDRITDVDAGSVEGVAVTGVDDSNGTWQFSTDGGSVWTDFGAVSNNAAVLLDTSARIRFVPDAAYTGPAGDVVFRAWDRTTGSNGQTGVDVSSNGGTTAFSSATETATMTVIGTNDAPVLTPSSPTLTTIDEDETSNGGDLVSSLLGSSVTDIDIGAFEGMAITGLNSSNGTWQYSTNGGGSWNAVPTDVSDSSALLLRDSDLVRFVPDGIDADAASFDFRAWDQTSGTAGTQVDASATGGNTAFSLASDTASITVAAVNDAPVLDDSGTMTLADIVESETNSGGSTVASIVASTGGDRITDVDSGDPEGIAVIGVDDTNGTWQFSTDGGTIWTDFGAVTNTGAVLLDAGDHIRFVPDPGYVGSAGDIDFRAWDQSTGSAGQTGVDASTNGLTTAFSTLTETATLDVTPTNYAPVLNPLGPSLTSIDEDATNSAGDLVSSLLGGSITDLNAGAVEGIAITSTSSGNGTWQFSINGGAGWNDFGAVSNTNALLLRETDLVRFVPDASNADTASFDYRAWDQTSGIVGSKVDATTNGGGTAFSTASDAATIVVTAVNDAGDIDDASLAPIFAGGPEPIGATVSSLFAGGFSDIDTGASFAGVAIVTNTADAVTEGTWQYSTNGGDDWFDVGSVGDDASALALGPSARLRFVPADGFTGATTIGLRSLDDSYAGGFASTAGGVEARVNVDASASGGTSAVGASIASLDTTILPAVALAVPDISDPAEDPSETPEAEIEEEEAEEETDETEEAVEAIETTPSVAAAAEEAVEPLTATDETRRPVSPLDVPSATDPEASEREFVRIDPVAIHSDTSTQKNAMTVLREIYEGTSSIGGDVLASLVFEGRKLDYMRELDAAKEDLRALHDLEVQIVSSTVAVTSGLSVGYVLWLTRGGLLMASLMSSLPAWKLIDPIPVLARLGSHDEADGDSESLSSMIEDGDADPGPVDAEANSE